MTHPSATLRGKVLTLPIVVIGNEVSLTEACVAAMRRAAPRAQALVTITEPSETTSRVLTVSSGRQRSLGQWKSILEPALVATRVTADWDRALVQMATPDVDHGR